MRVLICGGGVIGASIAYFLSCRGVKPIVIERTGVACAASGKSGGFLALDWCDGTPLASPGPAQLCPARGPARTDRRRLGLSPPDDLRRICRARVAAATPVDLPWLSDGVAIERRLGSTETTAQVHPAEFTAAMMRAAQAQGAELRMGRITGIVRGAGSARVTGVEVDGARLEGDAVVIAMGPWSVLAARWLPLPPVFGLKGHSIVFETGTQVPPEALFLEYQEAGHGWHSPEVVPRPDGTTWVCAISSESPVPLDPADVAPDPGAIERLHAICSRLSPVFATAKVLASQACHRPVTQDSLPLIGAIPGLDGAYVATGHSVWGILNAPATGEAMAELIADGAARTVDLAPFDPARLPPLDPSRLRTEMKGHH